MGYRSLTCTSQAVVSFDSERMLAIMKRVVDISPNNDSRKV
jgi:hypothetical protein